VGAAIEKLAFSPQEAATAAGLSLNTLYKLIKTGRLRHVKLDRRILISREALNELLNGANGHVK
jgi:excisionase family DNA binding protein